MRADIVNFWGLAQTYFFSHLWKLNALFLKRKNAKKSVHHLEKNKIVAQEKNHPVEPTSYFLSHYLPTVSIILKP